MIGECLSDRYEILAELGRGGMGVVYRARDPLLERDVAVKVISVAQITPEAEERFRREARLVARMDHPGIVPIYDLGSHRDYLFFVMPVVEGTTLETLMRQHSLVLEDTLEIVAQVAEALDYSHARGVVHRDIKPENVMVAGESGSPRARVMDFGLALVGAASRLTRTGKLPGTLHYLSPEQILSARIDGRSDLYSLGTILYECLAGGPPFSGSRYSLLYRIAHEAPPTLESLDVDTALNELVLACLDKDPDTRPERGQVLAEALRRYKSGLGHDAGQVVLEHARSSPGAQGITPLAGRRQESEELRRRFEETLSGGCRFVALGGDAGLGKTRLLQLVEEVARSRTDAIVVRGRFSAADAFAYEGFGELVRDYFREREPSSSTRQAPAGGPELTDLAGDLLALFPALSEIPALSAAARRADGATISVAAAAEDHTRLFELLARTLTRLAGGRPLVILLEQLHASEASIEALRYLLRRLGPTSTLVVGTYRPAEIDWRHPLNRLLRGIKDDPRASSIVLAPLDETEHREMLATLLAGSELSDSLVESLHLASEGNPYFIREWVRWLLETGGILRDEQGTWKLTGGPSHEGEALPETIQQAVEARLEQLPERCLEVLRTASVLGPAFDLIDLDDMVTGELEEAIEGLIRDGLLEEDSSSRRERLIFSSRLVRKTLYRSLSRRRRRRLHRHHAERLEQRWQGRLHRVYPQLVQHFAQADVADKTIRYALELARAEVGGFGWEAAIRATRTALELVEEETSEEETSKGNAEGQLRRLLAAALRVEGQLDLALREATRAVRSSVRAQDHDEAARAAQLAAEIAWQGRRVDTTRTWVARGLELAASPEASACRRKLLYLGSTLANLGGEYAEAAALREQAESLASQAHATQETATQETVPAGGTLVVSLANPLSRLDLGGSPSTEEIEVLSNVYERLLESDETGHLVPTLCREWEGTQRGRVFRFTLRDEVRFFDGTRLLAQHVKRSFEHAARESGELPAPAFRAIEGMEDFLADRAANLEGILALDERVVEFRLSRPLPIFPALLTDPRTAITGESGKGSPRLGTGAFRWPAGAVAEQTASYVLEKRDDDWRRRPARLDRLEFRILDRHADPLAGLISGDVDLVRDLLEDDLEDVQRHPRLAHGLREASQKNVFYLLLNSSGPAGRSLDLRRVLLGVIDVQDLVWRTLGRFARPATGLMPPGILGHDPGRRRPIMPHEEAATWVKAAAPLPALRGAVHPRLLDRYAALVHGVVDSWRALGIEVDLRTTEAGSYLSRVADPSGLDFCFGRWDFAYDDPDNIAFEMLHSRHGRVAPYLCSSAADPLLERARQEVRAGHRQHLYQQIEEHMSEQATLLALLYDVRHAVAGSHVRGLRLLGRSPFVNYAEVGKLPVTGEGRRLTATGRGHGGTVQVAIPVTAPSLAPESALFQEASEVLSTVYETLTGIDEGAHVVPRLASEFRLEDMGRRYRFRLRRNVYFHDGRPLSVRDVRYSFERMLRDGHDGAETALLPIRGARRLRAGEASELAGFHVVSEREFVLELESPLSFFPAMLSSPTASIVPEAATCFDGDWRRGTAGTGAFRVVRFVAGERLELEANPRYWRAGLPRCDRLVFQFDLASERIAGDFRAGKLALASHLRPNDLEDLRRDPELAAGYSEAPGFSTYYLALNRRAGALADPERRRALAGLFDTTRAVRETLGRVAVTARGLIPPGLLGQSRRAMRPATGTDPRELVPLVAGLELRCAVHPAYRDTYGGFWRHLVQPLADAEVSLLPVHRDAEQMVSAGGDDVDLFATRWVADYPDSDTFVHLLHTTEGIDGRLCGDSEIDLLILQGRAESDPERRRRRYHEIEKRIRQEALVIPLFHESTYRFVRPELRGLRLGMRSPVVAYEELGWKT